MKQISKQRLLGKLEGKDYLELADLLGLIEEEFEVKLQIEIDVLDVGEITTDQSVIDQIRSSREDRNSARTYSGESGLQFLREKVKEFDRESDL